jgi:hypothetical protein
MMSECNYLLGTNKLSYEDLLKYLRRRERAYISFLEFCIDRSVFSKEVLLDILHHQELNKSLFSDSLKAIAGEDFANDLIKVYNSQVPSIFRYIEYSDQLETKIKVAQSYEIEPLPLNPNSIEPKADANILTSTSTSSPVNGYPSGEIEMWKFPDLGGDEPEESMLDDFLLTFDDQKRTEIENTIMVLRRKSDQDLLNAMSLLYRDFHSIKGSSRFARLRVFESITHDLEDLIASVQNIFLSLSMEVKDLFEEAMLLGVDVLVQLKQTIVETRSEYPMAEDSAWIEKVNQMFSLVRNARTKIFEAQQNQTEEDLLSKF